ncbi:MAG: hypothetical protein IJ766_01290 [Clostridia bacterium]|nr:hypothetical protein [Clostridia bacterium]
MNYTANYQLKKPEENDFFDVEDFNGNMDAIDDALTHAIGNAWQAVAADAVLSVENFSAQTLHVYYNPFLKLVHISGEVNLKTPVKNPVAAQFATVKAPYLPRGRAVSVANGFYSDKQDWVCGTCMITSDGKCAFSASDLHPDGNIDALLLSAFYPVA